MAIYHSESAGYTAEAWDANALSSQSPTVIRFPALTFNGRWLLAVSSIGPIVRSSKLAFNKKFYKDLALVDSDGNKFQVAGARKLRTLFSLRFGELLELLGGNPTWEVELTFGPPSQISLDETKRLISDCFTRNEEYWEEMSRFEDFRDKVAGANSLGEIFGAFKEFHLL
jgi:hypothetical protein